MTWIVYLAVAALIFVALRGLLPSPLQLNAATNALLAEHLLQFVELVPENTFAAELRDRVIVVWSRISGKENLPADRAAHEFNSSERVVQLNVLAVALHSLKHTPMLPAERWCQIRDPFKAPSEKHIEAVRKRLAAKHGVRIELSKRPLQIVSWGISDA